MSVKKVTNVAASVTARIKNWAKANAQSFQHALTRYATERSYENICQYAKSLWRFPHQSRLPDVSLSPIRNVGRL